MARAMINCEFCGDAFVPPKATSRFCGRQCQATAISRATALRRGDALRGRGDGKFYRKRQGRHEHLVIAEEMLGRALLPAEVVHHRNHDRLDNRPENLEVLPSQAEHARRHFAGVVCQPGCECGKHDTYERTSEHRALMSIRTTGIKKPRKAAPTEG